MDPHKRQTLIKWLDALSDQRVQSFDDLRDGRVIVAILMSVGDHLIPSDTELGTPPKRLAALKICIEGFYHQAFDDGSLIDFSVLSRSHALRGDAFDMQMGKLLLALLGCMVQDKCRERFIAPALEMDERSQFELKEMIESVLFNMDSQLPADFDDVLKRKTDTCAHLDAALFLKLVAADGVSAAAVSSPRAAHGTPINTQPPNAPAYAMYSNSPQPANTSGINIRDISSPLRVMSLSSPVTPLSALMHSPQLAQKIMSREVEKRRESEVTLTALLRQKSQEAKRLELALQNERHLRSELEMDLRERSALLEEKDVKLRDLERQVGEVRWMRDQLDELELLRSEKEKLSRDVTKLQSRLTEYQDVREHNHVLERENREALIELQKAREEMKLLDAVKKSSEEYRVKCHKQQLDLSEMEASLQHRLHELEHLQQQLEEARNMYQVSVHTCNSLKQEKEELEEMMGTRNGMMGMGLAGAQFAGESMSIVTEKRMSELQSEYDQLRASWIDPVQHQTIKKQLEMEADAKKTYEDGFVEMKKKLMCRDDEVEKLTNTVQQYQSSITQLETSLSQAQVAHHDFQCQVTALQAVEAGLRQMEAELVATRDQQEAHIQALEKELSQTQTELKLTQREIEVQVEASENRRATILQLDTEKLEKHRAEQRLSAELQSWKSKLKDTQEQLQLNTENSKKNDEVLRGKLQILQTSLDKAESELHSEKMENEKLISELKQKVSCLEEDMSEVRETLESERKTNTDRLTDLESRIQVEKNLSEERLQCVKSITKELEELKSCSTQKEESMSIELSCVLKDKKTVELELHRLKLEFNTASESYKSKYQKLETKLKDKEAALKLEIENLKSASAEHVMVQKRLKEELSTSNNTIQKQKEEIEKLSKIIAEFKSGNSELGDSLEKSKMTVVEYEYQMKALWEKYENEQEQNAVTQKEKNEMINSMQNQLDSLMNQYRQEKSQLSDKIKQLESTVDINQKQFTDARMALESNLSKTKSDCESQISNLIQEHSDTIKTLEKDKSELKLSAEAAKNSLEDKLKTLEQNIREKESARFEMECSSKEKDVRIESISKELDYLKGVEMSLKSSLNILETDYDTMKNMIKQREEIRERLEKVISEKEDKITNLEATLNSANETIDNIRSGSQNEKETFELTLNEQRCGYEQELTSVRSKLEITEQDAIKLKEELQREIDALQISVHERTSTCEELQKRCDVLTSDSSVVVSNLTSEIDTIKEQLQERVSAIAHSEQVRSELESQVKHQEHCLTDLRAELNNCKADAEQVKCELESQVKHQDHCLTDLRAELHNCKADAEQVKCELESQVKHKDQCLTDLRAELDNCKADAEQVICKLESQVKHQDQCLTDLRAELDNCKADAEQVKCELESQVKDQHQCLTDLRAELDNCKADAEQVICKLESQVKHQDQCLTDLRAELGNCKADAEQVKCELESQVKHQHQSLTDLRAELDNCKANAEQVKYELESQIRHLDECQADLGSKLTASRTDEDSMRNCFEEKIGELSRQKSEVESEFRDCRSNLEHEIVELKDKLVATESYWRSQCEQLEEEYSRGAEEQRDDIKRQLEDMDEKYENEIQKMADEKDMYIASKAQAYHERVTGLERVIEERKAELETVLQEKSGMEAELGMKIGKMSDELAAEVENHKVAIGEVEKLKLKVLEVEEEKKKELEMLIGQYETQLEELRLQLTCSHGEVVQKLNEEYTGQVAKLNSVVEEQRVNHQQIMCKREEKLVEQVTVLRERFSQMKCQYETIIETNKKDKKNKVNELETKVKSLEEIKLNVELQLGSSMEENVKLKTEIAALSEKNTEYVSVLENAKCSQSELENKMATSVDSLAVLEAELCTVKEEVRCTTREEMIREKGEREELQRQLTYTHDTNDTLTAELSSQQQQLAAVEEEKRVLEMQVAKLETTHTSSLEDVRQKSEKDLRFIEIEKMELERQLQASQKCYEAVQKSETELERQIEKMTSERGQLETRNRELEQRIYNYLEREKNMVVDNQHQIEKAAELNGTMRRQLDEKCRETQKVNEAFNQEMEAMRVQVKEMKTKFDSDLNTVREDKTALEIEVATLCKVQEKLTASETERQRLQDINEKYNIHYNKKKETITKLTEEMKLRVQEVDNYRKIEEKLVKEVAPLREKLDGEILKNKSLSNKVRTLEAQTDLAERKIREYRQQLDKVGTQFLGDGSQFQQMMFSRENAVDASFMENYPSSVPLNDSVFDYEKQKRHSSLDQTSSSQSDETLTPGTRASRSRRRISKSVSTVTVVSNDANADTVSIGSASSLAYRLRSRESAASLNRSIHSVDSCRSNASVPRGTGGLYHCEDEPMEFEWGRLGELQRRNTLCPAHLKTSYPVETQTYKPNKFRDDALRESTMGNVTLQGNQELTGSGRKRKQGWDTDSSSDDNKNKLAKTGCVYQKPGPPTPANSRRNSGKGTASKSPNGRRHSGKSSKSPRTPTSLRGRSTPKRTPKFTPKRSTVIDNRENPSSGKKSSKRDSVAYSIGFSPLSLGHSNRLTRQQAFIQKQPASTSQPVTRKPLGTRNFLQTGL